MCDDIVDKPADSHKCLSDCAQDSDDVVLQIRVFCRVRPGPASAVVCLPDNLTVRLEGATEGIKDSTFAFDKVFGPQSSQADVFAEVSDLVQSALDGYKVGASHLCCLSSLLPILSYHLCRLWHGAVYISSQKEGK